MKENTGPVYVVGQHVSTYRCGELAMVIGLEIVKSENGISRGICFRVMFIDGEENHIPLIEVGNENAVYRLLTPNEIELKLKKPLDGE
ncbi:hypothetical protein KKA23_03425 [Patescibacteria group bacterium]|nr:hypothetical protein [Patescibacteria group bacterium]MBU3923188.1 hypothetical protein [Patescibacteria group bacterium]